MAGRRTVATSPPSFDPTGRSYEHNGLPSRHERNEVNGPGGDKVDDGADDEAQSLEQLTSSSLGVLTSSDDGDEIFKR